LLPPSRLGPPLDDDVILAVALHRFSVIQPRRIRGFIYRNATDRPASGARPCPVGAGIRAPPNKHDGGFDAMRIQRHLAASAVQVAADGRNSLTTHNNHHRRKGQPVGKGRVCGVFGTILCVARSSPACRKGWRFESRHILSGSNAGGFAPFLFGQHPPWRKWTTPSTSFATTGLTTVIAVRNI